MYTNNFSVEIMKIEKHSFQYNSCFYYTILNTWLNFM
ncbi:unnamed protein product [Nezara viridula]|uniref:Uncharacterized protein n=1 Tax=Nezara viridula TaxID=85310 RepID=A0A9P0MKJ4_NEZVI|nr:unnamed protein product [Nezara viridula]